MFIYVPVDNANNVVLVNYVELSQYEVSFAVKKPYARGEQIVHASSSSAARRLIEAQYGKDNVTIYSVRQVKKNKKDD